MGNNPLIDGELAEMMAGSGSAMGKMFDALDTEKKVEKVMEETDLVAKIEKQFENSNVGAVGTFKPRWQIIEPKDEKTIGDSETKDVVRDSHATTREAFIIRAPGKPQGEPFIRKILGKSSDDMIHVGDPQDIVYPQLDNREDATTMYSKRRYNRISEITEQIIIGLIHADLDYIDNTTGLSTHRLFKPIVGSSRNVLAEGDNVFLVYGDQTYDISTMDDVVNFINLLKKVLVSNNPEFLNLILNNVITKFKAVLNMEE